MSNITLISSNSNNMIEQHKPAMYTDHGHPIKTTAKYRHVNTADVVATFNKYGWEQVKYSEANTRKYKGYQTHIVQMACRTSGEFKVGDSELRALIVNDHKGSKALHLKLGLYRFVCANGLVVSDGQFECFSIRHVGERIDERIREFIDKITIAATLLRSRLGFLSSKILTNEEARQFATAALAIRFKDKAVTEEMITSVLQARRSEDLGMDAWTVFNRVQENITRGFQVHREATVRQLTSVKRDLEINEKLWQLLPQAA